MRGGGQAVYATGHIKNAEPKTYLYLGSSVSRHLFKEVPVAGPLETSLKVFIPLVYIVILFYIMVY